MKHTCDDMDGDISRDGEVGLTGVGASVSISHTCHYQTARVVLVFHLTVYTSKHMHQVK